jgi:transcriptional regulator with XRE-family HTH domain
VSSVFEQPWTGRHLLVTQRLRQRRDDLGLTQKQVVSRLARLGVMTTNRALSSLEHGAGLDIAKLPELARVLDCTLTYLVGLTDDPHSWVPDPDLAAMRPPTAPQSHAGAAPHTEPPGGSTPDGVPERRGSCILGTTIPDRPRRIN